MTCGKNRDPLPTPLDRPRRRRNIERLPRHVVRQPSGELLQQDGGHGMRSILVKAGAAVAFVGLMSWSPAAQRPGAADVGPTLQSIGPMTFGPNGVLFVADTQAASIFALELGTATSAAGAKDLPDIDKKIAALLGT